MADNEVNEINKLMEENYSRIKKNGKFWVLLLLSVLPDFYFSTQSLHVIKLKAKVLVRCEIKSLESTSWTFKEIQKISQPIDGIHKECFMNDYKYDKIANMSFKDAKKFVKEKHAKDKVILCKKFVASKNHFSENVVKKYTKEFANYCQSVRYDIYYDILALIPNILSCLFFVPLADIVGRKRILSVGCYLALLSVFMRVFFLGFTRNAVGEMVQNFAYPALKFSTQTIIFEISGNMIRPLAFVVAYTGLYIPLIIYGALPPMYWKYLELLTFLPALFLPLVTWLTHMMALAVACAAVLYLRDYWIELLIDFTISILVSYGLNSAIPILLILTSFHRCFLESPIWFISRKKFKTAHFAVENLNNFTKQNEIYNVLRNQKTTFQDVKNHFREFKEFSYDLKFISLALISIGVGFASFYPYSKHKFLYHYFEESGLRFLNYCGGLFGVILCIPCLYLCGPKIYLALLLCANGVLYITLGCFDSAFPYQHTNMITISTIEVTATTLTILFHFYLQKIVPASHKCTCIGIIMAILNSGLLVISGIRLLSVSSSDFLTAVMSLFGLTLTLIFVRNVHSTSPQIINFSDIDEQAHCPECCKFCKK